MTNVWVVKEEIWIKVLVKELELVAVTTLVAADARKLVVLMTLVRPVRIMSIGHTLVWNNGSTKNSPEGIFVNVTDVVTVLVTDAEPNGAPVFGVTVVVCRVIFVFGE